MNVNEIREKSRSVIGPYCKSCPVCNGKACSNKIPGPGAKGTGTVAIKNYDAPVYKIINNKKKARY